MVLLSLTCTQVVSDTQVPNDVVRVISDSTSIKEDDPNFETNMAAVDFVGDPTVNTVANEDQTDFNFRQFVRGNSIWGSTTAAIIVGFVAAGALVLAVVFWVRRKPSQMPKDSRTVRAPKEESDKTGLNTQEGSFAARGSKNRAGRPKACLVQINNPSVNGRFPIEDTSTLIGRANPSPDDTTHYFEIDRSTISRKHAMIQYDNAGYWLIDLESINGTFVNDKKVTEKVLLKHDDIIRFDDAEFQFEMFPPVPREGGKSSSLQDDQFGTNAQVESADEKTMFLSAEQREQLIKKIEPPNQSD